MGFEQFLEEIAEKGEVVNLVFEERLFRLVGILQKITHPLTAANVPFKVSGGLAVLIHVERADPTHSVLTRDVDIMIHGADLDRVIAITEAQGFKFRRVADEEMILFSVKALNQIHLVFDEICKGKAQ